MKLHNLQHHKNYLERSSSSSAIKAKPRPKTQRRGVKNFGNAPKSPSIPIKHDKHLKRSERKVASTRARRKREKMALELSERSASSVALYLHHATSDKKL